MAADRQDGGAAPLVSIALCTYNGARFLREQLESLLAQTHPNLEIVVADDCSSDGTPDIVRDYARRDPRISLEVNAQNLGFKRNFAAVLRRCRGDYIAPCDQDDVWAPEKVERLIAVIGERALAYCDSTIIDEHGRPAGYRMSQVVRMLAADDPAPFAFGNCVSGHAMLFRRELIERASPAPDAFFHDWWIAAVAAAHGGIAYCDESLVLYRQHGANVTDGRFGEMLAEANLPVKGRPSASRKEQPPGLKLQHLRETEERLAALAALPGPHQRFIARLHRLWRDRNAQWISPALGWLMMSNRERLLALSPLADKRKRRYCRQFFWGLRLKRLTNPYAYATDVTISTR